MNIRPPWYYVIHSGFFSYNIFYASICPFRFECVENKSGFKAELKEFPSICPVKCPLGRGS